MKIVIATTNIGKKKNLTAFLKGIKGVTWEDLKTFNLKTEPNENADTFMANAVIKAQFYAEKTGQATLAEDSGLVIEAFPDKFGVKTRRQIEAKTDNDWLRIFLEMMEDKTNRKAHFYSAIAFFCPKTQVCFVTRGHTSGEIVDFPAAPIEKGIPVSSVFKPDEFEDVYSAMTPAQKAKITHRGKAAQKMKQFLENFLKNQEKTENNKTPDAC